MTQKGLSMSTYYTDEHEWITLKDDGVSLVGITSFAAEKLGEIVYLELKEPGFCFKKGEVIGLIESVKVASDIYAPLDGEVIEANAAAAEKPALLNESPEADGWLYRIKIADRSELSRLMTAENYQKLISSGTA